MRVRARARPTATAILKLGLDDSQGLENFACVPVGRGFNHSFGYLSGATDHVDQAVPVCAACKQASQEQPTGFGCVDLWRDLAPAYGENGTYTSYSFSREAISIVQKHDPSIPIFIYLAWQEVHGPYEVPSKFRELFPPDPFCHNAGKTANTCCGVTDHSATNVSDGKCMWGGKEGVCKCNGGITGFQPQGLTCPPGETDHLYVPLSLSISVSMLHVVSFSQEIDIHRRSVRRAMLA